MKNIFTILLIFSLVFSVNSQDIAFNSKELYPEGIAYSKKQDVFFVSSLKYGKIGKVTRKGIYKDFIVDPDLVSTIGIHANEKDNVLYVCVSDPGVAVNTSKETQMNLSKLITYDLKTGKRKSVSDLGAITKGQLNLANDVDFDESGNIYVTNSSSPVIYKISKDGEASIFTTYSKWDKENFNLNGIVVHPDGYLIVSQTNTGELYKILIADPKEIIKIKTDEIIGADGIFLNGKTELIVISNTSSKVFKLNSIDNFVTAKITKSVPTTMNFPTTGIVVNKKCFVLNAKLTELFNPQATKTSNFLIQEIKF